MSEEQKTRQRLKDQAVDWLRTIDRAPIGTFAAFEEEAAVLRKAATRLERGDIDQVAKVLNSELRTAIEKAQRARLKELQFGQPDFTSEERRLILSALHPDDGASKERREAAFKLFDERTRS